MEDIRPEEVVEATARNRRDACCLVVFHRIRRVLPALVEKRPLESMRHGVLNIQKLRGTCAALLRSA